MKFTMKIGHLDGSGEPWMEHENRSEIRNEDDAKAWSENCLKRFNDTLRPHEKERKLLGVFFDVVDNKEVAQHIWRKTNLMTVSDPRLGVYDTMKCELCGITGKRYGLISIKIDSKYRAKGYKVCPPELKPRKA